MKKVLLTLILPVLIFSFSLNVFASKSDEAGEQVYEKLFDSISDETKQALEETGLDSPDYEKLINLSPRDLISYFYKTLLGKLEGPVKIGIIIFAVVTALGASQAFFPEEKNKKDALSTLSCVIVGMCVIGSIFALIKAAMSVIDMTSKFMIALLPVLAGLIASCRNPVMAVSMNALAIYSANIISSFANKYLSPFMSVYLVLSSAGCLFKDLNISSLCSFIKNTVLKTLALLSSFYISFLSLKGLFTNSVDTVVSKGAKLLISTAVPVIGSSLSEAYFAMSGSLLLLKNSVGTFAIIVIALINVPMIIELFLWSFCLNINVQVCKVMNVETVAGFLDAVSCVIKTLNIILIFCLMLFIISTGLMIAIRSAA